MEHMYPIIDRDTTTPISVQIADHYRHYIQTGAYRPGELIPHASDIASATDTGYGTANDAINALAAEGIVCRKKRFGSVVRHRPRPRVISADRYRDEIQSRKNGRQPDTSAITRDLHIPWDSYRVEVRSSRVIEATAHQAELIGVNTGDPVYRRATVDYDGNGTPLQCGVSLMHPRHVDGTFLQDASYTHRAGGTIEELHVLGLQPDSGSEWLRSRDANASEIDDLQLYRGAIVYELTRVFYQGSEVVEASQIVVPALGVTWKWSLNFQN